jgi:hypothetical protein
MQVWALGAMPDWVMIPSRGRGNAYVFQRSQYFLHVIERRWLRRFSHL